MKKKIISLLLVFLLLCSTAAVASENAWVETSKATPESYYGQSQSLAQTNLTTLSSEAYDAIEQLASSLDYDPVKLYYYVRNNVDYEPYFGVMAGPEWTMMQGAGNSFDQALLLSSLFREAGIQTRYVYGEIEVSADDAVKWLRSGNPTQAARLLASSGIPTICIVDEYGNMVKVRKEHMWVEAKLPPESDWTKLYDYVEGMESALDLTWSSNFLNEVLNTAEYDSNQGWVTSVNGTFVVEKMDEYAKEIFDYILSDAELRNQPFTQVFGYWELQEENLPFSPSRPYEVLSSNVALVIPEEYYHKAGFKIGTINYSVPSAEIAGKRITIHFIPATENDRQYMDSAGGIFNATPHMMKMKPVLFIEGESIAEGDPLTLGEYITLTTEFYNDHCPYFYEAEKTLTVGGFYAVVSNFGKVASNLVEKHVSSLNATISKLSTSEPVTKEEVVGELLYLSGLTYFYEADFLSDVISYPNIRWYRPSPSQVITSLDVSLISWRYENGTIAKTELSPDGLSIDFAHEKIFVVGNTTIEETAFVLSTGMIGSCLEHEIFEQLYGIESISTMKIFEEANNRGIRIYTITEENMGKVLPVLQLPDNVKDLIEEDVNAGRIVVVPEKNIPIKSWNGTGWASIDPETGVGEYIIRGGLRGKIEGGTIVDDVKRIYPLMEDKMEKIRECDILQQVVDEISGSLKYVHLYTEGMISENLREGHITLKQHLAFMGITKATYAVSIAIKILGREDLAVGLITTKFSANSYLPKLFRMLQSKIDAAEP
jgi:hypothetical protein